MAVGLVMGIARAKRRWVWVPGCTGRACGLPFTVLGIGVGGVGRRVEGVGIP